MLKRPQIAVCIFSLVLPISVTAVSQELVKPPEGFVRFKLSNLRVEGGILGEVIAVDYKRTQTGRGVQDVQLAARTDNGRLGIMGFSSIDESGTIRLRDQFPGLSQVLGEGQRGMEIFLVVNTRGTAGFYDPSMSRILGGKEYLVSNVIRRGTMNSKVSARPLTAEERSAFERARKAALPPEQLPRGYTRGTANTRLVAGAPIKVGVGGQWRDAEVVALPTSSTVKVKTENSDYLRTVSRKDWIALSDDIAIQIRKDPSKFATRVRSLPGGNLVLKEGFEPVTKSMKLLKGTPLVRENGSTWQAVHFLSSDNVSVRVLVNQFNKLNVAIVPKNKIAIRGQTLLDMKKDGVEETFAANVEGYETQIAGLAQFPGDSGDSTTSRASNPAGALSGGAAPAKFPSPIANTSKDPNSTSDNESPLRTWSDSTGKYKVEAQLVEKDEQSVTLRRPSGKIAKVPLSKLSDIDLKYLKALDEKAANPFAALVENDTKRTPLQQQEPAAENFSKGQNLYAAWDYSIPLKVVSKVTDLGWGPKSVAISPEKKLVIIGRGGAEVSICDLESGQILMSSGRMDHIGDVTAAKYTSDGKFLVIGGTKGTIEVYKINSAGKLELAVQFGAHTGQVNSISFSSDDKYAFTGGADKEARYWEVATGRQVAAVTGFKGKVKATRIRSEDRELLATDGKTLIAYDLDAKRATRTIEVGRTEHCQSAAISPNGLLLAVDDGYKIVLWNLESFRQMPTIAGTDIPWKLVFGPDSRHLFSGHNGVVNIWDTKTQGRVSSCTVGSNFYVQTLSTSTDGSTIACSSAFAEVTVLRASPAE